MVRNHNNSNNNSVSFATIHVRDYALTVGDNPACRYGAPVSLDWSYAEHAALAVDRYEDARPARRNARQMHLSAHQRRHILLAWHGATTEQLADAQRAAQRVQRQRAVTTYLLPVRKLEDAAESAARKARRFLGRHKGRGGGSGSRSSDNLMRHGGADRSSHGNGSTAIMARSKSTGWLIRDGADVGDDDDNDDDTIASGVAHSVHTL